MGVGAGALSVTALAAACGIQGESEDPGAQGEDNTLTTNEMQGELNFANWPLYIDRRKGTRPTIDDFTEATGIEVDYKEVIEDNESFFGTIREPLSNDQGTGWDLIVVTDWLIAKLIRLGYLEEIDHSLIRNFNANAGEIYKDPDYDPVIPTACRGSRASPGSHTTPRSPGAISRVSKNSSIRNSRVRSVCSRKCATP